MFSDAKSFNSDLSSWDVSKVTSLSETFNGASAFNSDLSAWDVSKVTGYELIRTFADAKSFNSDLSKWNVSKVIALSETFNGAAAFNSDLSVWDVSKVTGLDRTFANTKSFNSDLSKWDVSLVTSHKQFLNGAAGFTENTFFCDGTWSNKYLVVTDLEGSGIIDFSCRGVLLNANINMAVADWFGSNATKKAVVDAHGAIGSWNVSKVTNMEKLFQNRIAFNADVSKWNTASVTNMRSCTW